MKNFLFESLSLTYAKFLAIIISSMLFSSALTQFYIGATAPKLQAATVVPTVCPTPAILPEPKPRKSITKNWETRRYDNGKQF